MWKRYLRGLLLLGVGAAAGYQLAAGPAPSQHKAHAAAYICPMHPEVVSQRPGSCPVCGMDLVEKAESSGGHAPHAADDTGIRIDPGALQNMGVRTVEVENRRLARTLGAVGRVAYDETGMSDVNTKVDGWVEALFVDYTGQRVEKGQPLLELYSPALVNAQEEYLTALGYRARLRQAGSTEALDGARDLVSAAAQRLRYWDITQAQIAELERARRVRRTLTLYAPRAGVVIHKAVVDGAHIKAGEHLYRIADLERVWLHADIYEADLPWVEVGATARVRLPHLPDRVFAGEISYIAPFLDPQSRTATVRLGLPNPDGALKPETFARVEIDATPARATPVLPDQAPVRTGDGAVAVVSLGGGRFEARPVRLGLEADGYVQILEGLEAGESVVASSQFLIDSESNLQAALDRLATDHAGHAHP